MARPTKLTKKVEEIIVEGAKIGNYREVLARAAGIHPDTLRNWVARGEEGGKANARYVAFLGALTRAEAEAETEAVKILRSAMPKDPRVVTEFLRRRYPERWSTTDRIAGKVEHEHSGTISHEHEEKIDGQIESFVEELDTGAKAPSARKASR